MPGQARERPQHEAHGPCAEAVDDDRADHDEREQHGGEHRGAAQPGDLGEERRGGQDEQQQGEHVVDALHDRRPERLGSRRAGLLVQDDDPRRLARAHRQDHVEELADQRRPRHRSERRTGGRCEQQLPAPRADRHGRRRGRAARGRAAGSRSPAAPPRRRRASTPRAASQRKRADAATPTIGNPAWPSLVRTAAGPRRSPGREAR